MGEIAQSLGSLSMTRTISLARCGPFLLHRRFMLTANRGRSFRERALDALGGFGNGDDGR